MPLDTTTIANLLAQLGVEQSFPIFTTGINPSAQLPVAVTRQLPSLPPVTPIAAPPISNPGVLTPPTFSTPEEPMAPLPPFSPGAPVDVSDLQAQLAALLQPTPDTTPRPGLGSRLLNQIPQALAVLLARDPGGALQEQLAEMKKIAFAREQQERARKERQEDLRRTVGIDLVRGEIENRRQIASERRRYDQNVAITGQEQAFRTKERQAEAESRFRLAEYDAQSRVALQDSANAFRLDLQKRADERDDMARYTTQREKHRLMGIPPEIADEMAQADVAGQPYSKRAQAYVDAWTANEAKFRDTARNLEIDKLKSEIARNRAQAAAARSSAGARSHLAEGLDWVGKQQWGLTQDGRMVILDKMAKDFQGNFVDEAGKPVTPIDARKAQAMYLMREGQALSAGSQPVGQVMSIGEQRALADNYDAQIRAQRGQFTDDQLATALRSSAKTPDQKEAAEQAIIRNGLEKKVEGKKRRMVGGSSVPMPNIDIGRPSPLSGIPQIMDSFGAGLDALRGMFRKNTPEENLRLLEEMRKRGEFGK
jgi:hypothetical protein